MIMNMDPQNELDEPESSEAYRNFDFRTVDEHLASATVPPWREAQLARMKKGRIHPTDRRNMAPGLPQAASK